MLKVITLAIEVVMGVFYVCWVLDSFLRVVDGVCNTLGMVVSQVTCLTGVAPSTYRSYVAFPNSETSLGV